ncbi:hemolysin XhlA family protein [Cellulosilyticum sp. ST5]|uniref:hemolysin XhlA family protein n=1 Tax=Cellulosilyticum sp. ST5 TaxID=3055805 RepID=UPI00397762C7
MPQDTQDVLQEIKEKLGSIKTAVDNIMPTVDLKLDNMEDKLKVANHRILDLEEQNKWLWRCIAGAIIAGVIAMYFR